MERGESGMRFQAVLHLGRFDTTSGPLGMASLVMTVRHVQGRRGCKSRQPQFREPDLVDPFVSRGFCSRGMFVHLIPPISPS